MKKTTLNIALTSALLAFGLSGCGSDCSEESLKEKSEEISKKVEALAAAGDMQKMMEFAGKAMQISSAMQDSDDLQAACDAADELLDELD